LIGLFAGCTLGSGGHLSLRRRTAAGGGIRSQLRQLVYSALVD
jgi:hypothetical protein